MKIIIEKLYNRELCTIIRVHGYNWHRERRKISKQSVSRLHFFNIDSSVYEIAFKYYYYWEASRKYLTWKCRFFLLLFFEYEFSILYLSFSKDKTKYFSCRIQNSILLKTKLIKPYIFAKQEDDGKLLFRYLYNG